MSLFFKAGAVALACVGSASATLKYTLNPSDNYAGANFFDYFNFITDTDPNSGFVAYQSYTDAASSKFGGPLVSYKNGAAYMGVDYWNQYPLSAQGRPSVRIESQKTYTHGLFVADIAHMPSSTCGLWPAFWTVSHENYPNQGEIDIIENIHEQTTSLETLHTNAGCTVVGNQLGKLQTGNQTSYNCWDQATTSPYGTQSQYQGCSAVNTDPNSYGSTFNAVGGGVYAMEWTSTAIRIWNFPPSKVPADLKSGNPDTSGWGLPSFTTLFGSCDIDTHFKDHVAIFNTDFCGSYAGLDYFWQQTSCYKSNPTKYSSCTAYVAANPSVYSEAYWLINSLKIYQMTDVTSTSSSTLSSTSTSSSSSHSSTSSATTTSQSSTSTSSSTSSKSSTASSTSTTTSSSSSTSTTSSSTSSSTSSKTSSSSATTSSSSVSSTKSTSSSSSSQTSTTTLSTSSTRITTTSQSSSAPSPTCSNPVAPDCSALIAAVPTCAQSCLQAGAKSVGCAVDDFVCQCTAANQQAITVEATSCVLTACGSSALQVLTATGAVCKCENGPAVCPSSSSSSSTLSTTSSSTKVSSSSTSAKTTTSTSAGGSTTSSSLVTSSSSSTSTKPTTSTSAGGSTTSSSLVTSSSSSTSTSAGGSTTSSSLVTSSSSSVISSSSSLATTSSSSSVLASNSSSKCSSSVATSSGTAYSGSSSTVQGSSTSTVPTFSLSLSTSSSSAVPTYSAPPSSSESSTSAGVTTSYASAFPTTVPYGNSTTCTSTSTTAYTTSTVYSTSIYTVTSCAPSVTNCPAQIGQVTTDIISLYTTICPVTATQKSSSHKPTKPAPTKPAPTAYTTSVVYTTTVYTVTSCAPTVTNCPAKLGHVTTEVVVAYTTVCPVTAAGYPSSVAPHSAYSIPASSYVVSAQTLTVKPVPYSTYIPKVHYTTLANPGGSNGTTTGGASGAKQSGISAAGGVGAGAAPSASYVTTNGADMKSVGGGLVMIAGAVLGALLL